MSKLWNITIVALYPGYMCVCEYGWTRYLTDCVNAGRSYCVMKYAIVWVSGWLFPFIMYFLLHDSPYAKDTMFKNKSIQIRWISKHDFATTKKQRKPHIAQIW